MLVKGRVKYGLGGWMLRGDRVVFNLIYGLGGMGYG